MGRAVALARSTLSAFFTGARPISRGNLELIVEYLGGDVAQAEALRRKAVPAWSERGAAGAETVADSLAAQLLPAGALAPGALRPDVLGPDALDAAARLELLVFTTATNELNRPDRLYGRDEVTASIDVLLDAGEHVLLYGLGGSGKTALAATIADRRV